MHYQSLKMENNIFKKTISLIGNENFNKISNTKICIIGLGGVGGTSLISLLRSGLRNFLLIDFDFVDESNLNRQLLYNLDDIGKQKTTAAKRYCLNINKDCIVNIINNKISYDFDFDILSNYDYIVDAIDDLNAKVSLIEYCLNNNLNIISSLGSGNRINNSSVVITKLNKTFNDPLAKRLRYLLKQKKVDISKLDVVFSKDPPIIKKSEVSSMIFVPSTVGLTISSYIINKIINIKNN